MEDARGEAEGLSNTNHGTAQHSTQQSSSGAAVKAAVAPHLLPSLCLSHHKSSHNAGDTLIFMQEQPPGAPRPQ
jgi:hypothetical protein